MLKIGSVLFLVLQLLGAWVALDFPDFGRHLIVYSGVRVSDDGRPLVLLGVPVYLSFLRIHIAKSPTVTSISSQYMIVFYHARCNGARGHW